MSANKNGKVFIPMSIDQNSTRRSSYFMSPLKMSVAMLALIPGVILSFYAYSGSGNNYSAMVLSFLLYLFFYSFLIRYYVLEERRLKRMLKTLEANKISKSDYFWGIEEIDDKGVIHYRYNNGLQKAIVVKISRGSLIGKPDDFFETHSQITLKFIRNLLRNNFRIMKYSKLEPNEMPLGIRYSLNRMRKIKDEAQRNVVKMNIDTVSKFTKEKKYVIVDYYVIYNRDIRLMKTFRKIVDDLIESTFKNEVYFRGSKILNSDEVVEFIANVLTIRSVPRKGYYDSDNINFSEFGKIHRLFDIEGNEVAIDLEKELFGRERNDYIKGKTGRSLESIEEEMRRKGMIDEDDDLDIDLDELDNKVNLNKKEMVKEIIIYEDEEGNLVDEEGNYVDEEGNILEIVYEDENGNPVDKYGNPIIKINDDEDLFNL